MFQIYAIISICAIIPSLSLFSMASVLGEEPVSSEVELFNITTEPSVVYAGDEFRIKASVLNNGHETISYSGICTSPISVEFSSNVSVRHIPVCEGFGGIGLEPDETAVVEGDSSEIWTAIAPGTTQAEVTFTYWVGEPGHLNVHKVTKEFLFEIQSPEVNAVLFLVEDIDGDQMTIHVSPNRQEAIEALMEMSRTGERMWVGGEIERYENEFGFRFKPDTIVVAEITAVERQASKYKFIQDDFEYWKGLGTIYILGKVVGETQNEVPVDRQEVAVNYQDSVFYVTTSFSNGSVISADIVPDFTSIKLAVEMSATEDGELTIVLHRALIDAKVDGEDGEFLVLLDGREVVYQELNSTDTERTLLIPVFAGAEEVEIIGTQVVPEFPTALIILSTAIISIVFLSKAKRWNKLTLVDT